MYSDDTTVRIPLRAKDGSVRAYTLVDAADAEFVNQWTWRLSTKGYAVRGTRIGGRAAKYRTFFLHRELLGLGEDNGFDVDHRNRDRVDNRRVNMIVVPAAVNAQNATPRGGTSQLRGVCWDKKTRKWMAYYFVLGKRRYLGIYASEEEAGRVARAARLEHMPYALD